MEWHQDHSLAFICSQIIATHEHDQRDMCTPSQPVSIDKMAEALGVKRRRIYDIVNVLESVQVGLSPHIH